MGAAVMRACFWLALGPCQNYIHCNQRHALRDGPVDRRGPRIVHYKGAASSIDMDRLQLIPNPARSTILVFPRRQSLEVH